MKNDNEELDPWSLGAQSGSEKRSLDPDVDIQVEDLGAIMPLETDLKLRAGRHVPDGLQDHLFPQETEARTLNTYALLDAGKMSNLPLILASSGLEHSCLYRGDAFEELGDVAPWLVQLQPDHAFTRGLFMHNPGKPNAFYMWQADLGIFIVSHAALSELVTHLRKFTIVQDADGANFYFRFWEGITWDALVQSPADEMAFVSKLVDQHRIVFRSAASFTDDRFFRVERTGQKQ